jgi:hypothetical protein
MRRLTDNDIVRLSYQCTLPPNVIRWRDMMGYPIERIKETTYPAVEQKPKPGTLTLRGVAK